MKSSSNPSDCSTCNNQGWDNYQDNFCKCSHGERLMELELSDCDQDLNDLMIAIEGGLE